MGNRDEIILENLPLVKNIASKFKVDNIGLEYDDLVSIGVMGLIDAYDKYDASKGVKFSTYATIRIKSHIIDEIRRLSPITRTDMDKIKSYNNCVDFLSNKLLREPKILEIAEYLNISVKDVKNIESSVNILNISSLDKVVSSSDESIVTVKDTLKGEDLSPFTLIEYEEEINILSDCIDNLKERDRLILYLYYMEELTLKEVGMVIGLSESRVSILHNKALSILKEELIKANFNYVGECVI